MSQFPNQYPNQYPQPYPPPGATGGGGYPPGYGQPMYPDWLAPARRASLLMIVLGIVGLMCGLCLGVVAFAPLERMAAEQGKALPQLPPGVTYQLVRQSATLMAFIAVPMGIAQLVTAAFIRRGGAGA